MKALPIPVFNGLKEEKIFITKIFTDIKATYEIKGLHHVTSYIINSYTYEQDLQPTETVFEPNLCNLIKCLHDKTQVDVAA